MTILFSSEPTLQNSWYSKVRFVVHLLYCSPQHVLVCKTGCFPLLEFQAWVYLLLNEVLSTFLFVSSAAHTYVSIRCRRMADHKACPLYSKTDGGEISGLTVILPWTN